MYQDFYGLQHNPFQLVPDPGFLYLGPSHQQALSYLRYSLENRIGFVVVTGEAGTGKTTLIRTLLGEMRPIFHVVKVGNTLVNPRELVEMVALDFGLDVTGSKAELLSRLNHHLIDIYARGERSLLIVDEAQNLSAEALEEIRMLSNLETVSEKLLQIFLLGQPELRDRLNEPGLRQLAQRVQLHTEIAPFTLEDTLAYVRHRLERAGAREEPHFSDEALELVHEASGGIPRRINIICDRVLLHGFVDECKRFSAEHAEAALAELRVEGAGGFGMLAASAPVSMPVSSPVSVSAPKQAGKAKNGHSLEQKSEIVAEVMSLMQVQWMEMASHIATLERRLDDLVDMHKAWVGEHRDVMRAQNNAIANIGKLGEGARQMQQREIEFIGKSMNETRELVASLARTLDLLRKH